LKEAHETIQHAQDIRGMRQKVHALELSEKKLREEVRNVAIFQWQHTTVCRYGCFDDVCFYAFIDVNNDDAENDK
jgi:hypothetical protein